MDTREFDGKTLYLINAGARRFGTMRSAGRTVTLQWPAEAKETGEVITWGSLMLKPEWLPKLKRNQQSQSVNYWGKRTPDYYYPADALE